MAVGFDSVEKLATAALFGAIIETGLFFVYLASFPISLWYIFRARRQGTPANKFILVLTGLLFVSVTAVSPRATVHKGVVSLTDLLLALDTYHPSRL
jgi:hypothetical protein